MSNHVQAEPDDVPVTRVEDSNAEAGVTQTAPAALDPKHLGHGVHARGQSSSSTGMHVEDAALPSPNHTGAGLGGIQIGDSRF